jgi:uncharacterized membrane protein YhaH (DUF805 family)
MYENSFTLSKMFAAYKRPLQFSGRSTRTELLGYIITFWLITTLFGWLSIGLGAAGVGILSFEPQPFMTIDIFNLLVWLPFASLAVRRFHDQGKAGWWATPLILLTILSWAGAESLLNQPVRIALTSLYTVALVLLFWKPTEGENRYGLDPRLDTEDAVDTSDYVGPLRPL